MSNTYRTDIPCECGEYNLEITSGFVGFMGSKPCSEDSGKCPNCGKQLYQHDINKRFKEQNV